MSSWRCFRTSVRGNSGRTSCSDWLLSSGDSQRRYSTPSTSRKESHIPSTAWLSDHVRLPPASEVVVLLPSGGELARYRGPRTGLAARLYPSIPICPGRCAAQGGPWVWKRVGPGVDGIAPCDWSGRVPLVALAGLRGSSSVGHVPLAVGISCSPLLRTVGVEILRPHSGVGYLAGALGEGPLEFQQKLPDCPRLFLGQVWRAPLVQVHEVLGEFGCTRICCRILRVFAACSLWSQDTLYRLTPRNRLATSYWSWFVWGVHNTHRQATRTQVDERSFHEQVPWRASSGRWPNFAPTLPIWIRRNAAQNRGPTLCWNPEVLHGYNAAAACKDVCHRSVQGHLLLADS